MAGSPKVLRVNGISFPIPQDTEPKVVKGGRYASEGITFGTGATKPIMEQKAGKISDMVVNFEGDLEEQFNALAKTKNLSIVYVSEEKSYQGTGYIQVSEGPQNNTRTGVSETFELVASTADGFRESART